MIRFSRSTTLCWVAASLALPASAASQTPAPVIDSIHVETRNIFDAEEASNVLFRLTNALHVTTQPYVVRRELLFRVGQRYDSAVVAETERNLRSLGIFRDVTIDTARVAGRLVVRVTTSDGWSTNLNLNGRSTGGVFTWSVGLTEQNVLGTANMAGVNYRRDVDYDVLRIAGRINRMLGSRVIAEGFYDDFGSDSLSGGRSGSWYAGVPFRALGDRYSVELRGEAANRGILRFRAETGVLDTTAFTRTAYVQQVRLAWAPWAGSDGYLRVGVAGQVRHEEFVPRGAALAGVPDTVSGALGLFGEWFRPRFQVVTHLNGFAREEDIDLGTRVFLGAWLAPTAMGYERTGVGPVVDLQAGMAVGAFLARLRAHAHGVFDADGLDSGQVRAALTVVSRVIPRQATVLHIEAGAQERPLPGAEFDLGHGLGPRAFAPHAFTGTRTVWGVAEHRAFLVDDAFGLMGIGIAGFLDYGGAWYADQTRRFGGNAGVGLRLGATRSTGPNVGRFDLAYQFGDGVDGRRWVFSFGRAFAF